MTTNPINRPNFVGKKGTEMLGIPVTSGSRVIGKITGFGPIVDAPRITDLRPVSKIYEIGSPKSVTFLPGKADLIRGVTFRTISADELGHMYPVQWREQVEKVEALPGNAEDHDVRYVAEAGLPYTYSTERGWEPLSDHVGFPGVRSVTTPSKSGDFFTREALERAMKEISSQPLQKRTLLMSESQRVSLGGTVLDTLNRVTLPKRL